ncbi:hypothetical protein CERSUDRAFT_116232 [Gelatoporia subvermispora B]|uniref:Uncharacterized protein n=1 Tax=Ceriporiopsis subvermispora (strain B) TaxID=914234 RepID=M2RAN8_CERS8|nr:hypothetical protein CERSUDRAFT_116232 [Gelatoporia subvermispora B]
MADLETLASIISRGVATIQTKCAERGTKFPTLDDPFSLAGEAVRQSVFGDTMAVIAAAHQLIATLQPPGQFAGTIVGHIQPNAALRAVMAGNVPEILRDAGTQGMHADEIAAKNNMDSHKLARLLRLLATYHVFKEVSPDVFSNNRISASLDTRKTLQELKANPDDKFEGTTGIAALVDMVADMSKSAVYLTETLTDPRTARSESHTDTAFNRAFGTELPYYEWLHRPENRARGKRFDAAMTGTNQLGSLREVLTGFEWSELPEGSVVVDVGGGVGSSMQVLYDECKHLKYVVQDIEPVIADAHAFWKANRPEAVESGQVLLQVHDFFNEQPIKNARIFFVRGITHNWPTPYAVKILRRLREAAAPETLLIVSDSIVQYACRTEGRYMDIPGSEPQNAPSPLLPNYGIVSSVQYNTDCFVMEHFNAQERTIPHFWELLKQAGWRLERVVCGRGERWPRLVASPI